MNIRNTEGLTMDNEKGRSSHERSDVLSRYMRDVEQRKRLDTNEETAIARTIVAQREEIADLLRAVLLKACDTFALDDSTANERGTRASKTRARRSARTIDAYLSELPKLRAVEPEEADRQRRSGGLRTAIVWLRDKARLSGLEAKIAAVATIARRKVRELEQTVTASFGISAADVCRVADAIAQRRQLIRQATEQLVESNLRLVVHVAQKSQRRGADVADLIQEGNLALLKAVDTFDPDRGVPFGSFAAIAVRHAIQYCGATAAHLVRVPEMLRTRRGLVRNAAAYLTDKDGNAPSVDAIAEYLELSRYDVIEALEDGGVSASLDTPTDDDVPSIAGLADAGAVDPENALGTFEDECLVRGQISKLDERKRRIIEARYGVCGDEQSSLAQIGRELGVTRERARQLQERALTDLRTEGGARRSRPENPSRCLRPRLSKAATGR